MIPKKKEDYTFNEGAGRPYEMTPRAGEPKDDAQRQKPVVIHLGELNGQDGESSGRVPKNYHPKRGRLLCTLTKPYDETDEEEFDIE
jgi:hypothetical protein